MFSTKLKEKTGTAHQQLEKIVVAKLKNMRNEGDYAELLSYFYAFFAALEKKIQPFVTPQLLPDHEQRRKASRLSEDLQVLAYDMSHLPKVDAPEINTLAQALGAMYVMEGSVMGGPIIIGMLQKAGINKGYSFFSGYGEDTGSMWGKFIHILNTMVTGEGAEAEALQSANETFRNFALAFETE